MNARWSRFAALIAACLTAGALAACSGEAGAPSADPGLTAAGAAEALPFLERVPHAPERVAHAGRRSVSYAIHVAGEVGGQVERLAYEERVWSDGQGRFAIELDQVHEPRMSAAQEDEFRLLQRGRQAFFFKYRDARIRDLALFLENYALEVLPQRPLVAGFETVEVEVRRRSGARNPSPAASHHRLAIEPRTGLVLRAIEFAADGAVRTQVEFLELALDPDLAGVEFYVEQHPAQPLDGGDEATAAPRLLPQGYRELASARLEALGRRWVRRVYGDGFESLFLLASAEAAARQDAEQTGAVEDASALVDARVAERKVRLHEVGPWRVVQLVDGPGELFVVGRVSESEILAVLQSAL